jgi:putative transport protein
LNIIKNGVVPKMFFEFTLILFVAAVGLLASKDLGKIIKIYGFKFMALGIIITFSGAIGIYIAARVLGGQEAFAVAGAYTGALTSSPGLAAAIETVARYGSSAEAQVGYGYAIAYAPGVLVVILCIQLIPLIFKIDLNKEKQKYMMEMGIKQSDKVHDSVAFDIVAFMLVCLIGYFVGTINFYLGSFIKYIKLGSTGGILLSGLLFGYVGRLGSINFRMNTKILAVIRDVSLVMFLSIVGLRYGYDTISSLSGNGLLLVFISFMVGLLSILIGFIVGRYAFGLNWIILSGAICGGMTSTPGLGVAIDAAKSDDAASGYGATYPFALICMVIFTIVLHKIVY